MSISKPKLTVPGNASSKLVLTRDDVQLSLSSDRVEDDEAEAVALGQEDVEEDVEGDVERDVEGAVEDAVECAVE
jgi:S1-C subfamily serine protease